MGQVEVAALCLGHNWYSGCCVATRRRTAAATNADVTSASSGRRHFFNYPHRYEYNYLGWVYASPSCSDTILFTPFIQGASNYLQNAADKNLRYGKGGSCPATGTIASP